MKAEGIPNELDSFSIRLSLFILLNYFYLSREQILFIEFFFDIIFMSFYFTRKKSVELWCFDNVLWDLGDDKVLIDF